MTTIIMMVVMLVIIIIVIIVVSVSVHKHSSVIKHTYMLQHCEINAVTK